MSAFEREDKVRVIGGKHRGSWGFITDVKAEFCNIDVHKYVRSIAMGDAEDLIDIQNVRAKKTYVEKIPESIFAMPEAEDVVPVVEFGDNPLKDDRIFEEIIASGKQPDIVEYEPDPEPVELPPPPVAESVAEAIEAVLDAVPPPPVGDTDLLSDHSSEEEPIDITGKLPNIEEAMALNEQNKLYRAEIEELKLALSEMAFQAQEAKESLGLYHKLSGVVAKKWF
tara:strand:- start:608 stop:1282 length:675 start_codon:yes stop_codon:yes gene_type:complete